MRDELIVEHRCIFLNLNDVDGHSGHLSDHNSAKRVGHMQLSVAQFKLERVAGGGLQDADLGQVIFGLDFKVLELALH